MVGLQIVKRTIGRIAFYSKRILHAMIAIIPASRAEIQAAGESELAVDDDEFLMVARVE
jgi:hypothetical protein